MARPNPLMGAYCGVASFKAATNSADTTRDAVILRHLVAASREIERLTLRFFYPYLTTAYLRWPQLSPQSTWMLWSPDDLLSVTTLQVAASGQNAAPVSLTHLYLEPNDVGPPFSRVETDLSYSDVFMSGPTPQRSIALTGMFGYCNTTVLCGTLTAPLGSSDTTLTASVPTAIEAGDVLLIDSEAIVVDLAPGSGTQTLRRGANGTTAAAHLTGATIAKYEPPADIQRVVLADAIGSYQADLSSWGRQIGSGEMQVEWQGKAIKTLRQQVVENYRRARSAAV